MRDPVEPIDGIELYRMNLGLLGRTGNPVAEEVNGEVEKFIPKLEKLLANGHLKPMDYQCAGVGFGGVSEGIQAMNSGKGGGKKIVVRLQDE